MKVYLFILASIFGLSACTPQDVTWKSYVFEPCKWTMVLKTYLRDVSPNTNQLVLKLLFNLQNYMDTLDPEANMDIVFGEFLKNILESDPVDSDLIKNILNLLRNNWSNTSRGFGFMSVICSRRERINQLIGSLKPEN